MRDRLERIVPAGIPPRAYAVIVAASAGQAVTVRWTWPLWEQRTSVPNLPLIEPLAQLSWGPALVVAALATPVLPRIVGPVFCGLYVLAALGDQTRLQPELVSLAILMTAPAFGAQGRTIARWHLGTLWLWAGIHKALSLGWSSGGAAFIAQSLNVPERRPLIAALLPATEIALGVIAFVPRLWKVAAVGGLALHLLIFVTLSPVFGDWNSSVWPWNIAAGIAALLLFWAPGEPLLSGVAARAIAVVFVVYPALFYVGVADAYLAHNLYTSNTATAAVCASESAPCAPAGFDTWDALNVPLPPEPRLYRDWFDTVCLPGAVLEITGVASRLTDPPSVSRHVCP